MTPVTFAPKSQHGLDELPVERLDVTVDDGSGSVPNIPWWFQQRGFDKFIMECQDDRTDDGVVFWQQRATTGFGHVYDAVHRGNEFRRLVLDVYVQQRRPQD